MGWDYGTTTTHEFHEKKHAMLNIRRRGAPHWQSYPLPLFLTGGVEHPVGKHRRLEARFVGVGRLVVEVFDPDHLTVFVGFHCGFIVRMEKETKGHSDIAATRNDVLPVRSHSPKKLP